MRLNFPISMVGSESEDSDFSDSLSVAVNLSVKGQLSVVKNYASVVSVGTGCSSVYVWLST